LTSLARLSRSRSDQGLCFQICSLSELNWNVVLNKSVKKSSTTFLTILEAPHTLMKFRRYAFCVPIDIVNYSTSVVKIFCLPSCSIATAHRNSRILFIYPLINLSSKKTTENRYSTNVTYLDHMHN